MTDISGITKILSDYIAASQAAHLPTEVQAHAKHHILDTFAAMISGSTLKAGPLILAYVHSEKGGPEAQVAGSSVLTSASLAALANGTYAHADETDDSHAASGTHPGCAVVPTALAMAERMGSNGAAFLRAVVAGYDVGCRVGRALQPESVSDKGHSNRSLGNVFGATAAAASLAQLDAARIGCALSYTAQQAAGIGSYIRARDHVEKAFSLGGMPARNAVTAVHLAQAGAAETADPFYGERNFLQAFSPDPKPEELVRGLGSEFEITQTSIKRFCVGSPIQAPLEALFAITAEHPLASADVERVIVHLPVHRAATVNNRDMADVSLQHIIALALLRGEVTFTAVHDDSLMADPRILALKTRIDLVPDPQLFDPNLPRQVLLEVVTRDGQRFSRRLKTYRGTPENPATTTDIEEKTRDLVAPVIGSAQGEELIGAVRSLETVEDMRQFRSLLAPH